MKVMVRTPYSGHEVGSVLEVPDRDGEILVKIGRAVRAEDVADRVQAHPRPAYRQRSMRAEPTVESTVAPPAPLVELPLPPEQAHDLHDEAPAEPEELHHAEEDHVPEGKRVAPRVRRTAVRHALEERAKGYGLEVRAEWSDEDLRLHLDAARRSRYGRKDMVATE